MASNSLLSYRSSKQAQGGYARIDPTEVAVVCRACGRWGLGGQVWVKLPPPVTAPVARVLCPECWAALSRNLGATPPYEAPDDDED